MQKKILALAVAAAISAPAFAADGVNVTVYGKAFASLDSTKTDAFMIDPVTGVKVSNSVMTVHTNASRLGFKGEDDLGDGYKATFQYEAEFNLDANSTTAAPVTGGGVGGGANAAVNTAFMGTRNSKVGMSIAPAGEFFVGNWDSPFKLAHNAIELNDNTTFGSALNVVGRLGATVLNPGLPAPAPAGRVATQPANMNVRLKDSFNYHSANFSGFQVKVALGYDDNKNPLVTNAAGNAVAPSNGRNQKVTAFSATYENDMFYAAFANQKHNDTDSTGAGNKGGSLSGTRLVGQFKFAGGFVGAMIENLKATDVTPLGNIDHSQRNLEISGKFSVTDKDSVGISYVKAGQDNMNAGGAASSIDGATQISLRYGHKYSARTELYAQYVTLKNGSGNAAAGGTTAASAYNFNAGTATALTSQAGANLSGMGVGMSVSF